MTPATARQQLRCSVCGCTETSACVDGISGETCSWIEGANIPICSFCAAEQLTVEVYSEAEADRYIRAMRLGA